MSEDRAGDREDHRADDAAQRLEHLLAEYRDPEESGAGATAEAFDPFAPIPAPGRGADRLSAMTSTDTADTGTAAADGTAEPEGGLPDAPLFALLRNVERDIGTERIDRIWVFPPRRHQEGETAVIVVAAFLEIEDHRRRVYAAHYTVQEEAKEPRLALDEYGTAPTDRVGRLVEEVVERIKDEPAAAPRSHAIEGRDERWNTVLHELAEAHLDEVQKNPRLRR